MNILRAIFHFFCEILLGCRHDHLTRPFTIEQQTYKVCLDCGRHLFYSADSMSPLNGRELRRMQVVQSVELKVVSTNGSAPISSEGDSRAVA